MIICIAFVILFVWVAIPILKTLPSFYYLLLILAFVIFLLLSCRFLGYCVKKESADQIQVNHMFVVSNFYRHQNHLSPNGTTIDTQNEINITSTSGSYELPPSYQMVTNELPSYEDVVMRKT